MTYSIVARDPETGVMGVAVQDTDLARVGQQAFRHGKGLGQDTAVPVGGGLQLPEPVRQRPEAGGQPARSRRMQPVQSRADDATGRVVLS